VRTTQQNFEETQEREEKREKERKREGKLEFLREKGFKGRLLSFS
jgi:hypothetical protein